MLSDWMGYLQTGPFLDHLAVITKNGDDCHISVVSNNDDDGMVSS